VDEVVVRTVGPATPFGDSSEACDATIDALERLGFGRWEIVDAQLDDLADTERLLLPMLMPDGQLLALRACSVSDASADTSLDTVVYAARMLSTLFAANKRASQWLERATKAEAESLTDDLTELPNARAWWRALARESARCDRYELSAVVAVIDLDDLKLVNDTQGHLGGDLLLRSTAQQLTAALRTSDLVARIGGDEFAVLAIDYDGPLPDLLLERLQSSLDLQGIRASCGAAVYQPGDSVDNVFKTADGNMYAAKMERRVASAPLG
jgi:diguanylate cyclase (GGDEF)-like protein